MAASPRAGAMGPAGKRGVFAAGVSAAAKSATAMPASMRGGQVVAASVLSEIGAPPTNGALAQAINPTATSTAMKVRKRTS